MAVNSTFRTMIWSLISVCALQLTACATSKYSDRDRDNPLYQEGSGIPVTDSLSVGPTSKSMGSTPEAAVASLVESGVALAAYPDYYKKSSIRGRCVLGESELEHVPCRHVKVELRDGQKKVIGSISTSDSGEFAFFVKKDRLYFLTLGDSRVALKGNMTGPLSMGAEVVLIGIRIGQNGIL